MLGLIILAIICICILRYAYCCAYNYVHRDVMYFNEETLEMLPCPKKKFIGKLKRFLTLMTIVMMMSSCSVTGNSSRTCTFTLYEDRVEMLYWDNGEKIVVPIEEGESFNKAYKRYLKEKRK